MGRLIQEDSSPNQMVSFFMKHVVPIHFTFQKDSDTASEKVGKVYSAFVLSVNEVWFLVTAGHCLRDIEGYLHTGWEIKTCLLLDGLSSEAKDGNALVFDYMSGAPSPIRDETKGLDYGIILLRPYYVHLLKANGIVAFDENAWLTPPSKADSYFMLGLPDEFQDVSSNQGRIQPALIKLEPTIPPKALIKQLDRFYAHIVNPEEPKSIVGMSGAPIIAINESGDYWLVAVQSTWLSSTRTIAGCRTRGLCLALDALMKKPR